MYICAIVITDRIKATWRGAHGLTVRTIATVI
jgi:hypothetical protein